MADFQAFSVFQGLSSLLGKACKENREWRVNTHPKCSLTLSKCHKTHYNFSYCREINCKFSLILVVSNSDGD